MAIKSMPSIECPTRRQNQSGYMYRTTPGSHVWAKLQSGLTAPAMSGLPMGKRNKRGYVTSTIFGLPKARGKLKWLHDLWRIGAHVWAELPQNQCRLGVPKGGRKSKWLHKECPLGGPCVGAVNAWHLPPWGPKSGDEIKVSINMWAHVWAKWLDKTYHLVGAQGVDKHVGNSGYITHVLARLPKAGTKLKGLYIVRGPTCGQKVPHYPWCLAGQRVGKRAT